MKWYNAGEPVTFQIPFVVDGQSVEPDPHSIRVTLRGNEGTILPGADHVPADPPEVSFAGSLLPSGSTEVITMNVYDPNPANSMELSYEPEEVVITGYSLLSIPSSYHTIEAGRNFETRFLEVEYTIGGAPFRYSLTYRVCPFTPMAATPAGVRALVGATSEELPDEDIDLMGAYFWLVNTYGSYIATALTSPTNAPVHVSRAIETQAAIDSFISLPSRILQMEKGQNSEYQRQKIDFKMLRDGLNTALSNHLALITASLSGGLPTISPMPIMAISTPTDPITGA